MDRMADASVRARGTPQTEFESSHEFRAVPCGARIRRQLGGTLGSLFDHETCSLLEGRGSNAGGSHGGRSMSTSGAGVSTCSKVREGEGGKGGISPSGAAPTGVRPHPPRTHEGVSTRGSGNQTVPLSSILSHHTSLTKKGPRTKETPRPP